MEWSLVLFYRPYTVLGKDQVGCRAEKQKKAVLTQGRTEGTEHHTVKGKERGRKMTGDRGRNKKKTDNEKTQQSKGKLGEDV